MPGHGQFVATQRLWHELPGLERVASGVALTFDDGPDPDATPALLAALDEAGLRATFFLVGEQVEAHPDIARELAERGHEIQLHCFHHAEHAEMADPADDIKRAAAAINDATGATPTMQRPPYGRFSRNSYNACEDAALQPVYWSAWGMDWEPLPAERIADLVTRDLADGAIALLHDSARYAPRESAQATVEAIPLIARAAAERGLTLGPISAAVG